MNWKVTTLGLLTLILFTISCQKDPIISEPNKANVVLAEQYKVILEKAFGGVHDEFGTDILEMENGDLLLLGTTYEGGEGKSDILLLRINKEGEQLWKRTFGNEDHDQVYGIEETESGDFILFTTKWEDNESLVSLIKVDGNGNELWQRSISGITANIIPTNDGGIAFLEYLDYPLPHEDYMFYFADVAIVKLTSEGKLEWRKTVSKINVLGSNIDFLQKTSGEFLILSLVFNEDIAGGVYGLVEVSEEGTFLGNYPVELFRREGYTSLVETDSRDLLLVSTTNLLSGEKIIKADLLNDRGLVLQTEYTPGLIYAQDITPVGNEYLITGVQYETQQSPQEMYIGKISDDLQFTHLQYNVPVNGNSAYAAIAHENGELSVIGYSKLIGNGYHDFYYLRLKPE